jgi:hypothetical protein
MTATDSKRLEFQEAILRALDIEERKAQLEVIQIMIETNDFFPAGSILGEEAAHLKKISKLLLNWEKLSRDEAGQ